MGAGSRSMWPLPPTPHSSSWVPGTKDKEVGAGITKWVGGNEWQGSRHGGVGCRGVGEGRAHRTTGRTRGCALAAESAGANRGSRDAGHPDRELGRRASEWGLPGRARYLVSRAGSGPGRGETRGSLLGLQLTRAFLFLHTFLHTPFQLG